MDEISDLTMLEALMRSNDGVSAVERLLNEFEAHETKEEQSLEEYRKALIETKEPAARFIMQMTVADEERHRALTHAMAATLRGSLNWTKPAESLEGTIEDRGNNKRLSTVTEEFISLEKAGLREYKRLIIESAGYYHGLFKILIGSMIRDTEKHIDMLEFLSRRLRAA